MVKQFTYYGLSQKELEELSLEKLLKLFPARARRSLTRGINDSKRKLIEEIKASKAGKLKTPINTHLRDLIILHPYITEKTFELVETQKKICFIVERTASKISIKNAIQTLYEQKALTINTSRTVYGKKAFVEFESVDVARDLATKIGML